MQNVLKFTDRIIKYLANSAERKTTRASRSEGHVILNLLFFNISRAKTGELTVSKQLLTVIFCELYILIAENMQTDFWQRDLILLY